ncbi:MAG: hypothetical protein ACLQVI_03620 [Polyangiaceae bacterium]
MPARRSVALSIATVLAAIVAGCGGRSLSETGAGSDGGGCVDLQPSPAELACTTDQDCVASLTGTICPGYVAESLCENSAANSAGAQRILSQLQSIPQGVNPDPSTDFCDAEASPIRCLGGQCTVCGPGSNGPASCSDDAGIVVTGAQGDGGTTTSGAQCSWPASLDPPEDAGPWGWDVARYLLVCNLGSGDEECMSNDASTCPSTFGATGTPLDCVNQCNANEYAVAAGGPPQQLPDGGFTLPVTPSLPAACRSVGAVPSGASYSCCPCE